MKAKIPAQVRSNPVMQAILILYFVSLGACANNIATPLVPTQFIPTLANTSTPAPTLSPTPISTSTSTPLNLHPQVVVLAKNLPEPDDLVLAPDGSIYISDVTDGTIRQYAATGQLNLILSGLRAPEGMAFSPDSSLIIAEQGTNRLLRYDPASKSLTPLLDLVNHTNNLGVDGILWDGSHLIVPDSPNGTLLEVSLDGRTVRQLSSGLARPTGAWSEPDGSLLIADENGNAVYRLHRDGTLDKIANFSTPDDVIEDAHGNIFVITLGDDAVHVLTPRTHQDVILISGLNNPQGIIFNLDGNLIVTDSGNHRLLKVLIH
jgi:sugar lactone lactonase YvrE